MGYDEKIETLGVGGIIGKNLQKTIWTLEKLKRITVLGNNPTFPDIEPEKTSSQCHENGLQQCPYLQQLRCRNILVTVNGDVVHDVILPLKKQGILMMA